MNFRNPAMLLAMALSVTGCIVPGPAYQPSPGYGPSRGPGDQYNYTYYPDYGVYFDPLAAIWFWSEGGAWVNGPVLPAFYPPRLSGGVTIVLDTRQPYLRHDRVVERYGGPRHEFHAEHDDGMHHGRDVRDDRPGSGPGGDPGDGRPGRGPGGDPGGDRPGRGPGGDPGGDRPGRGPSGDPGDGRPGRGPGPGDHGNDNRAENGDHGGPPGQDHGPQGRPNDERPKDRGKDRHRHPKSDREHEGGEGKDHEKDGNHD